MMAMARWLQAHFDYYRTITAREQGGIRNGLNKMRNCDDVEREGALKP